MEEVRISGLSEFTEDCRMDAGIIHHQLPSPQRIVIIGSGDFAAVRQIADKADTTLVATNRADTVYEIVPRGTITMYRPIVARVEGLPENFIEGGQDLLVLLAGNLEHFEAERQEAGIEYL